MINKKEFYSFLKPGTLIFFTSDNIKSKMLITDVEEEIYFSDEWLHQKATCIHNNDIEKIIVYIYKSENQDDNIRIRFEKNAVTMYVTITGYIHS